MAWLTLQSIGFGLLAIACTATTAYAVYKTTNWLLLEHHLTVKKNDFKRRANRMRVTLKSIESEYSLYLKKIKQVEEGSSAAAPASSEGDLAQEREKMLLKWQQKNDTSTEATAVGKKQKQRNLKSSPSYTATTANLPSPNLSDGEEEDSQTKINYSTTTNITSQTMEKLTLSLKKQMINLSATGRKELMALSEGMTRLLERIDTLETRSLLQDLEGIVLEGVAVSAPLSMVEEKKFSIIAETLNSSKKSLISAIHHTCSHLDQLLLQQQQIQ